MYKQKLNVGLVLLALIAMAVVAMPAYAENVGYNANVSQGQSTSITFQDGNFGTILLNTSKMITPSVTLLNAGDMNASVEAKFNTNVSGIFGLVKGGDVIGASNFSLRYSIGPGIFTNLNDNGVNVLLPFIIDPNAGPTDIDARLFAPSSAVTGSYIGTVVLTFGNAV